MHEKPDYPSFGLYSPNFLIVCYPLLILCVFSFCMFSSLYITSIHLVPTVTKCPSKSPLLSHTIDPKLQNYPPNELDFRNWNRSFHHQKYPTSWILKVQLQAIVDLKPSFSVNLCFNFQFWLSLQLFWTSSVMLQSTSHTNKITCTFVWIPDVFHMSVMKVLVKLWHLWEFF